MTKVEGVSVPEGQEGLYNKNLQSGERYYVPRMVKRNVMVSRAKKEKLKKRSMLGDIAVLWWILNDEQRADWKSAGNQMNLNGWQVFVADTAKRMKAEIPGSADPSDLHQYTVGYIEINEPASSIEIAQYHPPAYYIKQKIPGHQRKFQPVLINERFSLPLELHINYRSDLVALGPTYSLQFHALIRHDYQGQELFSTLAIELDLVSDWKSDLIVLDTILGRVKSYTLFVNLSGVRGRLWFDLVKSIHSGQNWTLDPYCKDIDKLHFRAYKQVAQPWQPVNVPEGASYDSVYLP